MLHNIARSLQYIIQVNVLAFTNYIYHSDLGTQGHTFLQCSVTACVYSVTHFLLSHRVVRLSSPKLNVVFIVGIILVYMMVVLFGIDSNLVPTWVVSVLCQTRLWLGVIAFTLVYGSILAQTFRVFYILRNIKVAQNKDKIKVRMKCAQ